MSRTTIGLAGTATLLGLLAAAPAVAATGCPRASSGFGIWDVDAEPYRADNLADQFGNGDGFVCARPMRVVVDEEGNPFQLYVFVDNRLAAG